MFDIDQLYELNHHVCKGELEVSNQSEETCSWQFSSAPSDVSTTIPD